MNKTLYYHKASNGKEYLTNRWKRNSDGSKEGVLKGATIIVRLNGDIRTGTKITIADDIFEPPKKKEEYIVATKYTNQIKSYHRKPETAIKAAIKRAKIEDMYRRTYIHKRDHKSWPWYVVDQDGNNWWLDENGNAVIISRG